MRVFAQPTGMRAVLRALGAIGVAAAISTSTVAAGHPLSAGAAEPTAAVAVGESIAATGQERTIVAAAEEQPSAAELIEQPTWAGAEKDDAAQQAASAGAGEQLTSADPTAPAPVSPIGRPAPRPMTYLDPPFERIPAEGKAIFVNIPSYELIAFEDGQEVLRSRVIVGSPKHPTPEMSTKTSVVRFRPTWTPTSEMVREEGVSPETRPPGKNNPLGLLAIRFEAGNLIYLHDTNNRKLFGRDKRALSHGCVRVERWDEVAAFVLGIPVEEVRRHAEGKRTFDTETEGVPVVIRYKTKFPDQAGVVRDYADIYGKEARFANALKEKPKKSPSQPATNWNALPTRWSF